MAVVYNNQLNCNVNISNILLKFNMPSPVSLIGATRQARNRRSRVEWVSDEFLKLTLYEPRHEISNNVAF